MPKYPMLSYDTSEILRNSLREINFSSHGHRDARDTNIAEYSVAMLWLVANSTSMFPWTRELLRRHTTEEEENALRKSSETFENFFTYG